MIFDAHTGYIAASYGACILVLAVLIGWIIQDGRTQKHLIKELEERGVGRRSSPSGDGGETA